MSSNVDTQPCCLTLHGNSELSTDLRVSLCFAMHLDLSSPATRTQGLNGYHASSRPTHAHVDNIMETRTHAKCTSFASDPHEIQKHMSHGFLALCTRVTCIMHPYGHTSTQTVMGMCDSIWTLSFKGQLTTFLGRGRKRPTTTSETGAEPDYHLV